MENYDAIGIGGGPMGLSTAFHLSRRKTKPCCSRAIHVLQPVGELGGRVAPVPPALSRRLHGEAGEAVHPLLGRTAVADAHHAAGQVGTLWFGDPTVHSTEGNIAEAEKALTELGVPITKLTAKEIEREYHFRDLPKDYTGLFQPDGASIDLLRTTGPLSRPGPEGLKR